MEISNSVNQYSQLQYVYYMYCGMTRKDNDGFDDSLIYSLICCIDMVSWKDQDTAWVYIHNTYKIYFYLYTQTYADTDTLIHLHWYWYTYNNPGNYSSSIIENQLIST